VKKITKSRYVSVNDNYIKKVSVGLGFLGLKKLKWDFVKSGWWSRPYEYKLINDVAMDYFGDNIVNKTSLDFGCGPAHPGIFFLRKVRI